MSQNLNQALLECPPLLEQKTTYPPFTVTDIIVPSPCQYSNYACVKAIIKALLPGFNVYHSLLAFTSLNVVHLMLVVGENNNSISSLRKHWYVLHPCGLIGTSLKTSLLSHLHIQCWFLHLENSFSFQPLGALWRSYKV